MPPPLYTYVGGQDIALGGGTFPFNATAHVSGIQAGDLLVTTAFVFSSPVGAPLCDGAPCVLLEPVLSETLDGFTRTPHDLSGGIPGFGEALDSGAISTCSHLIDGWTYTDSGDDDITLAVSAPQEAPDYTYTSAYVSVAVYRPLWLAPAPPGDYVPYMVSCMQVESFYGPDFPPPWTNQLTVGGDKGGHSCLPTPWLNIAVLCPGAGAPSEDYTIRGSGVFADILTESGDTQTLTIASDPPYPWPYALITIAVYYPELTASCGTCTADNPGSLGTAFDCFLSAGGGTGPYTLPSPADHFHPA